jgi:hypothetical protein
MDTYLQNNPYFRISFGQGRDISHTNSSKGQNIFHCDITFNHIKFNHITWLKHHITYLILKKYSSLIESLTASKLKTHLFRIGVRSLSLTWTCCIEILWAYLKLKKYSSLIESLTASKLKTHFVRIGVRSLSLTWTCCIEILWAYLKY